MPPPAICSFLVSQFSEYPADCFKSHICVQEDYEYKMSQDYGIRHEFKHMLYLFGIGGMTGGIPAIPGYQLVEKIIIFIVVAELCKVILCAASATKGFTVTDLLKVIQTAGDTLIAVGIECIEVDARSAVYSGINF